MYPLCCASAVSAHRIASQILGLRKRGEKSKRSLAYYPFSRKKLAIKIQHREIYLRKTSSRRNSSRFSSCSCFDSSPQTRPSVTTMMMMIFFHPFFVTQSCQFKARVKERTGSKRGSQVKLAYTKNSFISPLAECFSKYEDYMRAWHQHEKCRRIPPPSPSSTSPGKNLFNCFTNILNDRYDKLPPPCLKLLPRPICVISIDIIYLLQFSDRKAFNRMRLYSVFVY